MSSAPPAPGSLWALHGFTGAPSQWTELLPFAQAPWLHGHGPEPAQEQVNFQEEVQRLGRLVLASPAPRFLVGYSMGARLALGVLLQFPELFQAAALVGVNPGLQLFEERQKRQELEASWVSLLQEQGLSGFLDYWESLPLWASQQHAPLTRRREQAARRRLHTAKGLSAAVRGLGLGNMPSLWEQLPTLRCPVELLVGENDEKFLSIAEQMRVSAPRLSLRVLPGVGHNPLLEAPQDLTELLSARFAEL